MMKKNLWVRVLGLCILGFCVIAIPAVAFIMPGGQVGRMHLYQLAKGQSPQRIISMAPGITETLFAIGAGKQVCGVTDFCDFPEAAQELPKVGGYYDPNFEAILRLKPDLVVLLPEHAEFRARFQYLRIPTLTVEMNSLVGIMNTFIQLGMICRKEAQGIHLAETLRCAMLDALARQPWEIRPAVMLVISRDYDNSSIKEVYIAGQGDFYDELIFLAGGKNAYTRSTPRYPKLSQEGILALRADVVVELVAEPEKVSRPVSELTHDWYALPGLNKPNQIPIRLLTGTYLVRPGPRIIRLLETLRTILQEVSGQ
ncbi:helical backbone metal receptor [bacterium]|nr:helical backbone metal receptor [bacterium]